MLTESQKKVLVSYRIPLEGIVAFDEKTHEVTFEDGTQRTLTDVITRAMGYLANKNMFNEGKVSEFEERKWFTEEKAKEAKGCKKLTK